MASCAKTGSTSPCHDDGGVVSSTSCQKNDSTSSSSNADIELAAITAWGGVEPGSVIGKTSSTNRNRSRITNTNPNSNHVRGGVRTNEIGTSLVPPLFFFFSDSIKLDPAAASIASLLNIIGVDSVRSC